MTHILSNLPEEYQTIIEGLEDELDDNNYSLTIKMICDNLSVKFDRINKQ